MSRLVAGGQHLILDEAVAATTIGQPIDVAADHGLLAVLEANGDATARLTLFHIDADGNLRRVTSPVIASPANGVAIVREQ